VIVLKSLVVDKQGKLSIVELSVPKYDDYRVLVKMESCGICNGTDLKLIHGKFKGFDTYPAILGHEGVGRVIETGRKVKSFESGDYVLRPGLEGETDGYYSGWGAFSEYGIAGDYRAMIDDGAGPGSPQFLELYYSQQKVPKSFDPVGASMIITFKEVLSAIKRFGFKENQSLVIFGLGPVGLSFLRMAKILGMGPVIVCDIQEEKLKAAEKFGADYIFNNSKVDIKIEVANICKDGVDYVVDAVGVTDLINQAMGLIKFNGAICVYGISPNLGMNIDWSGAPYNWRLNFVQWPTFPEEAATHNQIINWIEMGILNPNDFISHVLDFNQVIEAYGLVEQKKAAKIIIKF
jgi:threonine dehydrogenase-like Zn-dependent dehydrogenase